MEITFFGMPIAERYWCVRRKLKQAKTISLRVDWAKKKKPWLI